jgi:hypothetical protein
MGQLTQYQQEDRSALSDLIENGTPKALRLDSITRFDGNGNNPLLFLTPLSVYGGDGSMVLVSLEGHLCSVMELHNMDAERLWRIGLTYDAADMLINEIGLIVQRRNENGGKK